MVEATAFNQDSDDEGGGVEEKYFNTEFVGKFFEFASFEDAAKYIHDWIRVEKHNATEFTQDFPALLEQAVSFKKELVEGKKKPFSDSQIMAQNFELSQADYTVKFALGLLSACSMNEKIPNLIARIILNNIAIMASDGLLILSDEHKQWAKEHLQNCRADLIFDFVQKFELRELVNDEEFKNMAKKHIENNKHAEAAFIIAEFNFFGDFNCEDMILKLIDIQKIEIAKTLADKYPPLQDYLIKSLATNENCKQAAKFITSYGLNIDDYPGVKERLLKSTMRWYLGRYLYKKMNDEDWLPVWKIEDLFKHYRALLGYFVEDLFHKNKQNVAKGMALRNKIREKDVRPEIWAQLEAVDYNEAEDEGLEFVDQFSPIRQPRENYIHLPEHIQVEMVETEEEVEKLKELYGERYIGVDSEWRPALVKFNKSVPALFQISGKRKAFLVDLISLANNQRLDEVLTQIFRDERSTVVGFSFMSDIQVFAKYLPQMKFYKTITNFIDAQTYFGLVWQDGAQVGLAKVAQKVFGKAICKFEQMSNWENRPLRLSQQHYAALDAYVMVTLIEELEKKAQGGKYPIEKHIRTMDNRYVQGRGLDGEDMEDKDGMSMSRPIVHKQAGRKQKFDYGNKKDVLVTPQVSPDDLKNGKGLLFDKDLEMVSKYVRDRLDADVLYFQGESSTDKLFEKSVKEGRIFVTKNNKLFNKKTNSPIVCLPFKGKNEQWFQGISKFFGIKDNRLP